MPLNTFTRKLSSLILLSGGLVFSGSVLADNHAADQAAMKAQLEGVIDAYNNADPEAFKSAYTEDAWVISMRRPIKASREEIGAAFTPGMSQYLFQTELDILDVEEGNQICF